MLKNKASKILLVILISLSVLSATISLYPLLVAGPRAVYFNFEPEAAYIANAMLFDSSLKISYDGHPGTPSIMAISLAIEPLYFYAKYISHSPFFLWSIHNEDFLFYYVKVFQALLYATATGIFLYSIYRLTKSYLIILFAWVGLFMYSYTPHLGMIVQSEPLSFLILSLWLLVFSFFVEQRKYKYFISLCALSGLAVANKLPNIFFVFASVIQIFAFQKLRWRKMLNYFLNGLFACSGLFVLGTLPISRRYSALWKWIIDLATHAGIHGSGKSAIFDPTSYLTSINTLFVQEKGPILLIFLTFGAWIIIRKILPKSFRLPISLLVIAISIGLIVFAKFSLVHYHIFHYFVFLFIGSVLVSRFPKLMVIIFIGVMAVVGWKSIGFYWQIKKIEIRNSLTLESFIQTHPPKTATVWEWGKARDFVLLFNSNVLGKSYSGYLHKERPGLYNLTTDLSKIITDYRREDDVFSICWDQMYMQENTTKVFKTKYPNRKLTYQLIDNTENMYLITSDHCTQNH